MRFGILLTVLLLAPSAVFAQSDPQVSDSSDDDVGPIEATVPTTANGPATKSVKLLYPPSKCLQTGGDVNLSLITTLVEHFRTENGTISMTGSGTSGVSNGPEIVFANDLTQPTAANAAINSDTEWTVVGELPVLVSPYEVLFQYPYQGHFDWISIVEKETGPNGPFPDTVRKTATLSQSTQNGTALFRLSIPGISPSSTYLPSVVFKARIDAPDDEVEIINIGRSLGRGVRIKPLLDHKVATSSADVTVKLNLGGFVDAERPNVTKLCAELTGHLNPMATVPRSDELRLSPGALASLGREHNIRFVAANLLDAASGENVFRRFSVFEANGLTIVVYGIVGQDQLQDLSTSERKKWKITDPKLALQHASKSLRAQLQREPDLTIVMVATSRGSDLPALLQTTNAQIVIGPDLQHDLAESKQSIELSDRPLRNRNAALTAIGTAWGVNEIDAEFVDKKLRQLKFSKFPVEDSGPIDTNVLEAFREEVDKEILTGARVMIPPLTPMVAKHKTLEPLVYGDRVLSRGRYESFQSDTKLAFYSDPMWMRFVTNVMRTEFDTDVAISRNLPRRGMIVGPLGYSFLKGWLNSADSIGTVTLTGSELNQILDYIEAKELGEHSGDPFVFAAGLKSGKKRLINGRQLVADDPYSVAVTDHVVGMAAFRDIFSDKSIAWVGRGGDRERVSQTVFRRLESYSDANGNYDSKFDHAFENLLTDDGTTLKTDYKLKINELSFRGAFYRNTDNIGTFDDSKETRLNTPDNLLLGVVGDIFFNIDGETVGWTIGTRSRLDRVTIDTTNGTQESEQSDDLLLYTQLDINAIKVNVSDVGMPLIPYVRLEFDSEFTATPDPANGPDANFPHQKVFNVLAGAVLEPGAVLREIRVAPVARFDLSESESQVDFGVRLGYDLRWEIAKPLVLESRSWLEYLIPDSDDRASDLALRLISNTQLVMPIWRGLSFFAFLDLFYAVGATEVNDELGGSILTGGGFRFSDVWRF